MFFYFYFLVFFWGGGGGGGGGGVGGCSPKLRIYPNNTGTGKKKFVFPEVSQRGL